MSKNPTDEEEAAINRGIAADPDSLELAEEFFAKAVRLRPRGPGKKPSKVAVSIRLDRDVVEQLRALGDGWQTQANAALRKFARGVGR